MRLESSLSLYQCTLLPICTVATVQLLYTIRILTVTIPVHTVTNMYGSYSKLLYTIRILTVTISVHTVTNMYGSHSKLLYTIRILTVTISVHTVTNMYGSHSTVTIYNSNPHCHYISAHCYQYVR